MINKAQYSVISPKAVHDLEFVEHELFLMATGTAGTGGEGGRFFQNLPPPPLKNHTDPLSAPD